MAFIENLLKLLCVRCLGFAFLAFVLAGCAAKRGQYDVPAVPLPGMYNKMPTAADAADIKSLSAPPARADSKLAETPVSNPAENKQKIEKRMVKTTVAMLSDAFFKFDSDQLMPEAEAALTSVAETLRNEGYSGNIHLTGHTCNIGTAKYNQKLSERRALAIKKYLAGTGAIPLDAIVAEGQGENGPRYPNTKELRYKNRRVDLEFITFAEKLEDVALPAEPAQGETAKQKVQWEREYIDSEPAWQHNTESRPVVVEEESAAVTADKQSNSAEAPVTPLGNVLPEWWRLMGSSELDALMDRVLANNHDLRVAAYRVAQAKVRAEQASGDRGPVITLPVEISNQAPYYGPGSVPQDGMINSKKLYKASIRGDWRADIWGERQSQYESYDFQLWNATFQRDDLQRKLIANVVSTYVDYLSSNDRVRVAYETEGVLAGMLGSAQTRMEKGDATIIDVEQMRTAVYQVRSTIPVLKLRRELAFNNLAVLAGTVPSNLKLSDSGLDSLHYPAVLPGVPAALILRRPDVRAVEARLLAADADIDIARTRVLPPLDLSVQVGSGSTVLSQWFQPHTMFWSAIANLSATIFDNGKLSNEVKYNTAVHEEMVESYVRVIYGAVREVEDALMSAQMMGKRQEAQQESVDAAHRAWNYSDESYSAGGIDYLTVLDTERTYHRNLDDLLGIRRDRYGSLVDLFLALGGGVRQGATIPGDGKRPVSPPPSEGGSVLASAPQMPQVDGVDFSNSQIEDYDEEIWLAELPAVYDSVSIAPLWRDLRARFSGVMADRILLPRQQGHVSDSDEDRAAWYRLFVARFKTGKEAEEFCAVLISDMVRCQVVSSRSQEFREGIAAAPKKKVAQTETLEPAAAAAPTPALANAEAVPVAVAPESKPVSGLEQSGADAPSANFEAPATAEPVVASNQTIADVSAAVEVSESKPVSEIEPSAQDVAASPVVPEVVKGAAKLGYAVQLGSFSSPSEAARVAAFWQAKDYAAYVYKTDGTSGRVWFSVRLGNFSQRAAAAALAADVSKKERIKALPVTTKLDDAVEANKVNSSASSVEAQPVHKSSDESASPQKAESAPELTPEPVSALPQTDALSGGEV